MWVPLCLVCHHHLSAVSHWAEAGEEDEEDEEDEMEIKDPPKKLKKKLTKEPPSGEKKLKAKGEYMGVALPQPTVTT